MLSNSIFLDETTSYNSCLAQTIALFRLLLAVLLESDGGDVDESSRIDRTEVRQRVHRRILHAVEVLRVRAAAQHADRALVEPEMDDAVHPLLGEE
jgi:hypothetical protein